jgi:hypothetical protein
MLYQPTRKIPDEELALFATAAKKWMRRAIGKAADGILRFAEALRLPATRHGVQAAGMRQASSE